MCRSLRGRWCQFKTKKDVDSSPYPGWAGGVHSVELLWVRWHGVGCLKWHSGNGNLSECSAVAGHCGNFLFVVPFLPRVTSRHCGGGRPLVSCCECASLGTLLSMRDALHICCRTCGPGVHASLSGWLVQASCGQNRAHCDHGIIA
jgi:hypothetical protein